MSHFVVLVFGDNIEKQLEKYDERKRVPEYNRGEVSEKDKTSMLNYYQTNNNFVGTFEECYAKHGKEWDGNSLKKDENGVWCEFSTYNPDSKWDWYIIGGRWSGFFKLKAAVEQVLGKPGVFKNEAEKGYGDVVKKKDIDFEGMRNDAAIKAGNRYDEIIAIIGELPDIESWESVTERITDIKEARDFYGRQPRIAALREADHHFVECEDFKCTREEYVEKSRNGAITAYSIVKDGVWYQKGDMGWWGMTSNEISDDEWNQKVAELFDSISDDTVITMVDCHI
jgi:hypothetical protein